MVAAKVLAAVQSIAASTFAADELVLGLAFHFPFADQAATTIEA